MQPSVLNAISTGTVLWSLEGVEKRGDVAGVGGRDAHARHGISRQRLLRILNPERHVFGRIAQEARDVGPATHMQQRRADVAGRVIDSRNKMAPATAVLFDQGHPALGIAGKIDSALFRLCITAGKQQPGASDAKQRRRCVKRAANPAFHCFAEPPE
jgi:hypothetical protein